MRNIYLINSDVQITISFLMKNLEEMNRLWINLSPIKGSGIIENKTMRNDLNMLVGENIVCLSNLEGVDLETYKSIVMPQLLNFIVKYKDPLSQQYLIDCIIQVFPDEYHLHTLEIFLQCCSKLEKEVDIKIIIGAVMKRLSNYMSKNEVTKVDKEIDTFTILKKYIDEMLTERIDVMHGIRLN